VHDDAAFEAAGLGEIQAQCFGQVGEQCLPAADRHRLNDQAILIDEPARREGRGEAGAAVHDDVRTRFGLDCGDPVTLRTRYPGVYAAGDVTSVGTPKAGVFAEGQAAVIAAQISSQIRGAATAAAYDGRGICYLQIGHGKVAKVDVTFASGQSPVGDMEGPSADLVADKIAFGSERSHRWFGKPWHATQPDPAAGTP
jgi:hypothetical protein